ncbi:MAG: CRISPR-associated endonuclease Cas1 [Nitrospirota bacterium]
MGRTLYLSENRDDILVVRDGPSVLIKGRETAGRRVPVRLLGRVIIIGNIRIDAGAITLFAENDIPVVFMNRKSDETAVAIPYNHRLPTHYEEQRVFLANEENIRRYEHWAGTKRMVIQVNMLRRIYRAIAPKIKYGLGEGNYQEVLSHMKPKSEEKWQIVMGIITNLFRGLIVEHLLKADLDPHMGVIHRRHNFGFALDVCHIMGAESDMQALQFFRRAEDSDYIERAKDGWRITNYGMRNIVHRFENRRKELHNMAEGIIDELFELMRELRT